MTPSFRPASATCGPRGVIARDACGRTFTRSGRSTNHACCASRADNAGVSSTADCVPSIRGDFAVTRRRPRPDSSAATTSPTDRSLAARSTREWCLMEVFSDTFVPTELGDWWFRSQPCPACKSDALRPVANLGPTQWLCVSCGRCWNPVHGHLNAVDPWTCAGCATKDRRACIALAQRDPRWISNPPSEPSGPTGSGSNG